jgi:ABC-2 type transport system ATP-binding protein
MTEYKLRSESLCRQFGKAEVLHNVNLSIPSGTICSLLGPNGAGKTTLLKLFMGLIHPTDGTCAIAGDHGLPRQQQSLQKTGCLIDGFGPPPGTRIQHLLGLSRDAGPAFDHARAMTLLQEKSLSPRTVWRSMSKGHKRWSLLMLLLCRGCEVLLLDEPATGSIRKLASSCTS